MNVHMNIQVCIAMLVQAEITEGCLASFITALYPIYFESGFSSLQMGCLACELPGSACLCHLRVLEIELWSPCLPSKSHCKLDLEPLPPFL